MKKILLSACVALSLLSTACGNCGADGSSCTANGTDSLAQVYGDFVGSAILSQSMDMATEEKANFLRGVQLVFSAGVDENSLKGIQVATQMLNELKYFEEQDIKINKAEILNAFKAAVMSDSVDMMDVQSKRQVFMQLIENANKAKEEAQNADNENISVKNGEIASKFIEDLKANDSSVMTTESGLSYKIIAAGTDPKPAADADVKVNYTGRHINGDVFDTTEGREPITFNLQQVVPGFSEGITLVGKGGKITLYIPGNLGYGENGAPGANIEPNEMLIFDVEVLDF